MNPENNKTSAPEARVERGASHALPAFFAPLLAQSYGEDDVRRIIAGCNVHRSSTLRANAILSSRDEVAAALDEAGIAWRGVPWYSDAFIIEDAGEKSLWDLPAYDEGKLYLQSLSSMLPPLILGAKPGIDILDMCAAPGGKTTQLVAIGGKGTRVTACEMHAPRAEKLEFNLRKQGATNVTVMRTDARRLDEFFRFDRILVDAPCSGSGTLRVRDPKLHARFTEKLIEKSVKAQRALLGKAFSLLKPGGRLVYSTCSILRCENEDVVRACLKEAAKRGAFEIEPIAFPGIEDLPLLPVGIEGTLCVCPTDLYEGFFVASIKRTR